MNSEDILHKKIGTKEPESLKPSKVEVQGVRVIEKKKDDKIVGNLIALICKHPDKEETIELSNVKIITNDKIKLSALWYNEDEDGNLAKRSASAELLKYYDVPSFGELIGKVIDTVNQSENNSYLCIKAY